MTRGNLEFNDHVVYGEPDILKQDRVLAALVKNGRIYVPLRGIAASMRLMSPKPMDGREAAMQRTAPRGRGKAVAVDLIENR